MDLVDEISSGYRACQVLLAAMRLKVFETIGHEKRGIEEIAGTLGLKRRGVEIVCNALVTLGILEKIQGRYRNSKVALDTLLPDSPRSKIAMLYHAARLYEKWGKLYDVVRDGTPVARGTIDPRLEENERSFALAMADIGRLGAGQTADLLDLGRVQRLLDVGGGPGVYSIEFARRYPQLTSTILDNENTIAVARENIENAGLSSRVHGLPGDIFDTPLPEIYDLIFLSNIVHVFSEEKNRWVIKKCAGALSL